MCMLDDSEGHVTMLSEADPVARKAHKCKECGREIALGERYHVDRFIWEVSGLTTRSEATQAASPLDRRVMPLTGERK